MIPNDAVAATNHTLLDARGLKCPLPVLKARKTLRSMAVGEILAVLVTDPGAPQDFQHFCATTGHEWIRCDDLGDYRRLFLRCRAASVP